MLLVVFISFVMMGVLKMLLVLSLVMVVCVVVSCLVVWVKMVEWYCGLILLFWWFMVVGL